ncbi:hypothetical protein L1987_59273 [Smallanthus sonchifolius]|uniref:Uncharacterized protein n=1 Tax=Smallanthus sonchifolius TaxID=185202 RepID=A0ACB9D4U2_9ASTR|nr:hypothetical protein L1987_59273 [Smallanthus sonchifolius]
MVTTQQLLLMQNILQFLLFDLLHFSDKKELAILLHRQRAATCYKPGSCRKTFKRFNSLKSTKGAVFPTVQYVICVEKC